ncbi:MAG TPA: choice-of-anchor Q domain-containing protein, partial [Polyangiaceae bacterium]
MAVILSLLSPRAHAAVFVVNSTGDARDWSTGDGLCSAVPFVSVCTLRAAVEQANASAGTDTIVLQNGAIHTLSLSGAGEAGSATGDLDLNSSIRIEVSGGGLATVRGKSGWDDPIFTVGDGADVRLSGLIISRGLGGVKNLETLTLTGCVIEHNFGDGGVVNLGDLTLIDTTVRDNVADRLGGGINNAARLVLAGSHVIRNTARSGAGIANQFELFVTSSTISDNHAESMGGGIYATVLAPGFESSVAIDDSIIELNSAFQGGGIHHDSGTLDIVDTTLEDNAAELNGGGLNNQLAGPTRVTRSIFQGNSAVGGGAIANWYDSELTLDRVAITNNFASGSGGGIQNIAAVATVTQSTFALNFSGGVGGGIHSEGFDAGAFASFLDLQNSTLSGNRATDDGGGVFNGNVLVARNVTIAFNTADADADGEGDGGGLASPASDGVRAVLANTIVGSNRDLSPQVRRRDCSGSVESAGWNLIEALSGCALTGNLQGNLIGISPRLLALADNGGSVPTHLPSGPTSATPSPALDTGAPPATTGEFRCSDRDQRSILRPRDGNLDGIARCDIGAVEL